MFWSFLIMLMNGNVSFKSRTDNTLHLELPNTENISFNKG